MKGALLILAWLLAAPAAAQPRTVAVQAGGELPGFDIAEAAPWLARQMDQAGIAGWHFAARDEGLAAPDRVEWRFDPLPYAGGGVRQFFLSPAAGVLKARAMVSAEARLYLGGQYQTTILGQEAVMGGTGDAGLAAFIARTTRTLEAAWRATRNPCRALMRRLLFLALLLALHARADELMQRANLTGDWGGERTALEQHGIQLGGDEILEALGNPRGGRDRGGVMEGRLEAFATVDLALALGWQDAILHANAYQIHGRGLSGHDIGNLVAVSNIEAPPATTLFGLWLQQSFANDTVSLRLGEIAADDEFFVSQYAPLFINATYGWPSILGINLPSGGPSYPLARPGVRLRAALSPRVTVSAAVFSGDPVSDESGFNLRLNGDAFAITEIAYSMTMFGLPGTMKLGAWHHGGLFDDQRTSMPRAHRGDDGGYFILDQLLWRTGAGDTGLAGFFRIGGDPPQRNLIALHMDGGLSYAGAFGRDSDVIGLGVSYEGVSEAATEAPHAAAMPAPDYESVIELSYQTALAPWWILQPDAQWVIHPGAKLLGAPPGDALVLGLRTAINL